MLTVGMQLTGARHWRNTFYRMSGKWMWHVIAVDSVSGKSESST